MPTVERGLREVVFCSIEIAGDSPSIDFDLGLLHQFEELPGIGREALDITTLALGIDRVEGERGFARARQAGDHDEAVARQLDIDVLEIVLPRAADSDLLLHA